MKSLLVVLVTAITMMAVSLPALGGEKKHRISPRKYAGHCLAWIIDRENHRWNPRLWNTQGSGAYGLPQALPASKMRSAGRDWRWNPYTQIRWMRRYTRIRYGSACGAKSFWIAHHWY